MAVFELAMFRRQMSVTLVDVYAILENFIHETRSGAAGSGLVQERHGC